MKRNLIHIGIMSVCLLVLLMAISVPKNDGLHTETERSSAAVDYEVLVSGLGEEQGDVPVYRLLAKGERDTSEPVPMVYYQYVLRSVGECACELELWVKDVPQPDYTPILCSPDGRFELRVPLCGMQHVKVFFQGKKLPAEYELIHH